MPAQPANPFDAGEALTHEQRLTALEKQLSETHGANQDKDFQGEAILSEKEFLILLDILGELIAGAADQRLANLGSAITSRIYSRLGI